MCEGDGRGDMSSGWRFLLGVCTRKTPSVWTDCALSPSMGDASGSHCGFAVKVIQGYSMTCRSNDCRGVATF